MALHGKNCKNHKNHKNLKRHPFSCSPPLVQEAPSSLTKGGEKASDGKMNSRESHVEGSCEGYCVFNHLPNPSRRRGESSADKDHDVKKVSSRKNT